MSRDYYNEFDLYTAQWLRNLIGAGVIPPGEVDTRSIVDVRVSDLVGFRHCHFFAGIGGWAHAAQLAGWPDDRKLWTGSCPCQPFSDVGKKLGTADERHLWPVFYDLIRGGRPPVVVGEQVASADGRDWLAGVRSDLEALGYEVGAADLCAAGVSAPEMRQRLYWVGYADDEGLEGHSRHGDAGGRPETAGSISAAGRAVPWDIFMPWDTYRPITDIDGRIRRCEPGTSPMAPRLPTHVGRLRAYGNAIIPQLAAEFLIAALECRP